MHAITMRRMITELESYGGKQVRMLDVGCGFGYSTLVYGKLAELVVGASNV